MTRWWTLGVVVMLVTTVSSSARAEDEVHVDPMVLVASESEDPESAGRFGWNVAVVAWNGPIAGVVEGGEHAWAWDGDVSWIGAGARFALGRPRVCDARNCLTILPWLDVGVAREAWTISEPDVDTGGVRFRGHAGLGVDFLFTERFPVGMTVFFRLHRAGEADFVPEDMWSPPYRTSLVFGAGLVVRAFR